MSGFGVGKAEGSPQVFEIAASELNALFEAFLSRMEENTHVPCFHVLWLAGSYKLSCRRVK